jgi:hypothetical protein
MRHYVFTGRAIFRVLSPASHSALLTSIDSKSYRRLLKMPTFDRLGFATIKGENAKLIDNYVQNDTARYETRPEKVFFNEPS